MVVSFIGLSFLSWGSVSFDRTEAWISSLERGACCKSLCLLLEHGPHVGDVVLLNGHREHRQALFRVSGPLLWKVSSAACDSLSHPSGVIREHSPHPSDAVKSAWCREVRARLVREAVHRAY